jgi:hypothetical protein
MSLWSSLRRVADVSDPTNPVLATGTREEQPARTYTHVVADEAELDYAHVLAVG